MFSLAVVELFQSRRRPQESRRQRKRQRKRQPLPRREWQTDGLEAGAKALAFGRGGGYFDAVISAIAPVSTIADGIDDFRALVDVLRRLELMVPW
jgi:hypothetical protein